MPAGREVLEGTLRSLTSGGQVAGFEMTEAMAQMMNGFTVLRLTSLMGAGGVKLTRE